jgi:AcrR family transcriptional regulator
MARTAKVVEDRREQILDAAITVFSAKGYSRTTNSDIAREAGITPGLIYYYFQSKGDLLQAIAETRSPLRLMRSLPPQAWETPPEQMLLFLIPQVLEIVESDTNVKLMRIFFPELLYNAAMTEPLRTKVLGEIVGFFRDYFARQQEHGLVRSDADPAFVAQMTLSCLAGFIVRRNIVRDPTVTHYSHHDLATLLTSIILRGIEPR